MDSATFKQAKLTAIFPILRELTGRDADVCRYISDELRKRLAKGASWSAADFPRIVQEYMDVIEADEA